MLRRVAAPVVLVLLLAGCGGGGDESTESSKATPSSAPAPKLIRRNPANASTTLTIGSKNFTEAFILGEIYAQALKNLGPEGQKVIEDVQKPLTEKVMQELNARVDIDKQKPEDVAADYLQSAGYVAG